MFFTINLSQDQSRVSSYLSGTLLDEIEATLKKGEKVLLYLNKRGAFQSMICEDCQHLFECPNCDVSLSVHHNPKHLLCHTCQHAFNVPTACHKCWGVSLKSIGIGTQQIEEIMQKLFPNKNVFRFDSDSMKNTSSKSAALKNMKQANIIIGTKMLTTGFDFEGIGLIGVILVEWELWTWSYDAQEKAYQNLRQLIGRGNRKSQETKILLQTFIPKNPIIKTLTEDGFKVFLKDTLSERKQFSYPPYNDFATLEYRNVDQKKALKYFEVFEQKLKKHNHLWAHTILRGTNTFRKNNTHHARLIIKWEDIRSFLAPFRAEILKDKNLSVIFDN